MSNELNLLSAVTPVVHQLQSYLETIRREHREDVNRISDKMDENQEKIEKKIDEMLVLYGDHETRLVVVENTRSTAKWLIRAVVVLVATGLFEILVNHFPQIRHP